MNKLLILSMMSMIFVGTASAAKVEQQTINLKTYPFSDPDPIPATATKRYPYFRYDRTSAAGVPRTWQAVILENDKTRVTLLPEVGGKVWAATDKVTGKDFLYCNHVMKFRDIAMRGPWLSGGIEFNFGVVGHAPSSSTPVDWFVRTNADASVSCFVASPEYITRTLWQVEVRLGKDADGFETHVTWFNASGLNSPLYHWMNAAYTLRGNPQFQFPGDTVIGHQGEIEMRKWPYDDKKRKLDVYENNAFGGPKSYHVLPGNNGFYAIWWPQQGFGSQHRSLGYEKYGRKIWLWALSREGGIWEDLLTDTDGQYTELQSGLVFNQPQQDTYKTPFKHPTFSAGATMSFSELWAPVRDLKAIQADLTAPAPKMRPIEPPKDFDWESAYGHYVHGVQLLRERLDNAGAAELRKAIQKDKFLACAYTALAGYELRRGSYAAVHALCRSVLAIDAYDAEANYLDGYAYFIEGDGVTARERLGLAALSTSFASASLSLVARSYLKEREWELAAQAAKKALAFNAMNLDALLTELIAVRGTSAAPELAKAVLAKVPLFHAARYELSRVDPQVDFTRYVRNELPDETYLDLGVWYAESGLKADAERLFALAKNNIMAAVHRGDFAAAKSMGVAGVFPFRRESLPVLEQAAAIEWNWKFRYLLAVVKAYFGYDVEADKLLDGCGNEPDEAVFYQYRATRRQGAAQLADLRRAQQLGDNWRLGRQLAEHFEQAKDYAAMLKETTAYIQRFPQTNPLEIAHARALLKTKRYKECMTFLDTVVLLPSEGGDNATSIWHEAQDALGLKRTWPERLGKGEPYPKEK